MPHQNSIDAATSFMILVYKLWYMKREYEVISNSWLLVVNEVCRFSQHKLTLYVILIGCLFFTSLLTFTSNLLLIYQIIKCNQFNELFASEIFE